MKNSRGALKNIEGTATKHFMPNILGLSGNTGEFPAEIVSEHVQFAVRKAKNFLHGLQQQVYDKPDCIIKADVRNLINHAEEKLPRNSSRPRKIISTCLTSVWDI